jgi:uncharacterized protein YggT (Ycf19 family)
MVTRFVSWIFGLIEALLAIRVVLSLLGADRANAFAQFIYSASEPLARPFFSLFGYDPTYGAMHLELGTVIAMVVYAVVAAGVMGLLRFPQHHSDM